VRGLSHNSAKKGERSVKTIELGPGERRPRLFLIALGIGQVALGAISSVNASL
jgi:hypothetical protein